MVYLARKVSDNKRELTIVMGGQFNFSVQREFRDAYSDLEINGVAITIDLKQVEYMDSSALGMLLVLRERSGGEKADISLIGCSTDIRKILDISQFGELFTITG